MTADPVPSPQPSPVPNHQPDPLPGMPRALYSASPSRLLAYLDCPRRYRMQYLDRPRPTPRPQRAHTSLGLSVHNALRDWWDIPAQDRTPARGRALVDQDWIAVGYRDEQQSAQWRRTSGAAVEAYLATDAIRADRPPLGNERTVSFVTGDLSISGRVDRLDDRDGELVIVDYKTSRRPIGQDDARTSLPLALYAAAVWKMFRRRTTAVELHHVPTATVVRHEHTPESLTRKVEQARSIAEDLRRADADYALVGVESTRFPTVVGPLCQWCDLREHCPAGQAAGPEKSDWAALED